MKIGILGGAFDPIHNGHLLLGEHALETFKLDEVWFLPNGSPPHKYISDSSDRGLTHRINMIERAIENHPTFKISLQEARTDFTSYTYLTLQAFNEKYPTYQFYFIVGADSLFAIEKWKNFIEIFRRCTLLVAMRGDSGIGRLIEQIKRIEDVYRGKVEVLQAPVMDISSSELRERIGKGKSIFYRVPDGVAAYIYGNNLYGASSGLDLQVGVKKKSSKLRDIEWYKQQSYDYQKYDLEKISGMLKGRLTEERYLHTQGVMYTAAVLAMKYHLNIYEAMIAGLLHDCGKFGTHQEQLEMVEDNQIVLLEDERENLALIHAPLGAYLARHEFLVTEEHVLDAIRYHTTGRPKMTLLEKIIYIADKIEPYRGNNWKFRMVRDLAFVDINQAICKCAELVIQHLKENNRNIGEMTIKTLEYYGGKKIDTT